jgi:diacylglycerol kinase family enzyme
LRTLIVHNPKSGFGSDAIFQFERSLVHAGDECVMRMLGPDFDIEGAVADAESFDVVTVSGGDGTVATLLYALRGRNVRTCVFPSGTANLLCSNIGNASEPAALARACRMGSTADLDICEISWTTQAGQTETRGFALMSGTGFDAQLMQAAIPNKASLGQAAYFAAALENPRPAVEKYKITVDGVTYEREGITCMVANNAMIQGDIQIVPDCRMDDGKLDVIVVETEHTAQLLRPVLFGLVDREGKAIGRPHLESFSGTHVRVECARPIPIEVDGEVVPGAVTSYEARVLPGAAHLVVDSMSPYGKRAQAESISVFGETDEPAYPDAP